MRRLKKRFLSVMGTFVMLLVLVGCGWWVNQNSEQPLPAASSSHAPNPNPSPTASDSQPDITPPFSSAPTMPMETKDKEIEQLISRMSLEEKIGQMLLIGVEGKVISPAASKIISEHHIGGIILYKNNLSSLFDSIQLVNDLKKANLNSSIPLFVSVDQEGGNVSRLPTEFEPIPDAARVGESDNESLAGQMGSLLARELLVLGMNVNFAPVLDVHNNNTSNPIGNRSFGNTPKLVSRMGVAVMRGMSEEGIISVAKHYPGHGDTTVDSHKDLPIVNKTIEQLEASEWIPFRAAIQEDVDMIMVAHIMFPLIDPDAPSSFSKVIIDEQLRGNLGYEGVVISDDMTMGAINKNYGITDAAIRSIQAGSDVVLIAHGYDNAKDVYDKLVEAVKAGDITEERIDQSVSRILALKRKYSLSDQPVSPSPNIDNLNEDIRLWMSKLKG